MDTHLTAQLDRYDYVKCLTIDTSEDDHVGRVAANNRDLAQEDQSRGPIP